MRISDWSSDVCSSDLRWATHGVGGNRFIFGEETRHRGQGMNTAEPATAPRIHVSVVHMLMEAASRQHGAPAVTFEGKQLNYGQYLSSIAALAQQLGKRVEIGQASCRYRECQYV